jgi:hypothetical protein
MEQSMEYLTNLYLVFVDFGKGFDSINKNKVWEVMNRYGIQSPTAILSVTSTTTPTSFSVVPSFQMSIW